MRRCRQREVAYTMKTVETAGLYVAYSVRHRSGGHCTAEPFSGALRHVATVHGGQDAVTGGERQRCAGERHTKAVKSQVLRRKLGELN